MTTQSPKRVQRKRTKGWKMPANTIYVGRPTKFGNPFYAENMTQRQKVEAYNDWIVTMPALLADVKNELCGKDLACWCKENEYYCHADILLRLANEQTMNHNLIGIHRKRIT